jgi:hypothetical protein
VGGGVAAVAAAVTAGLGISAPARRMVAFGVVDVGPQLGLPALPRSPLLLYSRKGKPFKRSVAFKGSHGAGIRRSGGFFTHHQRFTGLNSSEFTEGTSG